MYPMMSTIQTFDSPFSVFGSDMLDRAPRYRAVDPRSSSTRTFVLTALLRTMKLLRHRFSPCCFCARSPASSLADPTVHAVGGLAAPQALAHPIYKSQSTSPPKRRSKRVRYIHSHIRSRARARRMPAPPVSPNAPIRLHTHQQAGRVLCVPRPVSPSSMHTCIHDAKIHPTPLPPSPAPLTSHRTSPQLPPPQLTRSTAAAARAPYLYLFRSGRR